MYTLFNTLKSFVARKQGATTDNAVFRLHYKITAAVMLSFCVVVSAFQYIGDPINCFGMPGATPTMEKVIDEYCWIQSTFTLPNAFNKKVGVEVPHPGIDKWKPGDERVFHTYYQWVCFVLFFQALFFYIPHYLWKIWEGGLLQTLVMDLRCPTLDDQTRDKSVDTLVNYYVKNLHHHKFYLVKYTFCELMNLVNVIAQIFITDKFLGGEFTTYGIRVAKFINMDQEEREDPMVRVFPKMTKCSFHFYGPSGDVQKQDVLCILPLNIVNEKIYVIIWFWFILLAVVSGLQVSYRLLTIVYPRMRYLLLKTRARLVPSVYLDAVLSRAQAGDWFILYQLGKNVESLSYGELITQLAKKVDQNVEHKNLVV